MTIRRESDGTVPPVPIRCNCGNQICQEVYIEGVVLLHAGGGLWHELRGNCARCGEPFFWSAKSDQIHQVVRRKKLTEQPDA